MNKIRVNLTQYKCQFYWKNLFSQFNYKLILHFLFFKVIFDYFRTYSSCVELNLCWINAKIWINHFGRVRNVLNFIQFFSNYNRYRSKNNVQHLNIDDNDVKSFKVMTGATCITDKM